MGWPCDYNKSAIWSSRIVDCWSLRLFSVYCKAINSNDNNNSDYYYNYRKVV